MTKTKYIGKRGCATKTWQTEREDLIHCCHGYWKINNIRVKIQDGVTGLFRNPKNIKECITLIK